MYEKVMGCFCRTVVGWRYTGMLFLPPISYRCQEILSEDNEGTMLYEGRVCTLSPLRLRACKLFFSNLRTQNFER